MRRCTAAVNGWQSQLPDRFEPSIRSTQKMVWAASYWGRYRRSGARLPATILSGFAGNQARRPLSAA